MNEMIIAAIVRWAIEWLSRKRQSCYDCKAKESRAADTKKKKKTHGHNIILSTIFFFCKPWTPWLTCKAAYISLALESHQI